MHGKYDKRGADDFGKSQNVCPTAYGIFLFSEAHKASTEKCRQYISGKVSQIGLACQIPRCLGKKKQLETNFHLYKLFNCFVQICYVSITTLV